MRILLKKGAFTKGGIFFEPGVVEWPDGEERPSSSVEVSDSIAPMETGRMVPSPNRPSELVTPQVAETNATITPNTLAQMQVLEMKTRKEPDTEPVKPATPPVKNK